MNLSCISIAAGHVAQREKHFSNNFFADRKTALLILSDGETASASEILLEALCDNKRATCMGMKSFGKNFAQAIVELTDGTGMCFTIQEFFSPTGR